MILLHKTDFLMAVYPDRALRFRCSRVRPGREEVGKLKVESEKS